MPEWDVIVTHDFHKINLPDISIEILHQLVAMFDRHETGGRPILVQLVLPYGIADRFPDCYEVCKEISPFALSVREGGALRVAIHIRRGEILVLDSDRMLPNVYYINVAQNVARVLEVLKIDYQLELHTEVPNKEFIIQPDHRGISNRISSPTIVSPEMCRLDEFSVNRLLTKISHHRYFGHEQIIVQLSRRNPEQKRHYIVPSVLAPCSIVMDDCRSGWAIQSIEV